MARRGDWATLSAMRVFVDGEFGYFFSFCLHDRGSRGKEDGRYEGGQERRAKEIGREQHDYCEDETNTP